jgi:hypothetical protein
MRADVAFANRVARGGSGRTSEPQFLIQLSKLYVRWEVMIKSAIVISLLSLVMSETAHGRDLTETEKTVIADAIKAVLKDPDSAQIQVSTV